jgi:hypothetical protein
MSSVNSKTAETAAPSALDEQPPIGNADAMFEREKEGLAAAPPPPPAVDDFPDGGLRAWLVVVGVSILLNTGRAPEC